MAESIAPLISADLVRAELAGFTDFWGYLGADEAAQDARLTAFLFEAEERFAKEARMSLRVRKLVTYPAESLVAGTDYDALEVPYMFHRSDAEQFGFLRLNFRPAVSVEKVCYTMGPQHPILTWPKEWLRLEPEMGILHIVPYPGVGAGTLYLSAAGFGLALMTGLGLSRLPQFIGVDYTIGAPDFATGVTWALERRWLAKLAAREALLIMGRGKRPGVASESISGEGLSQSVSYTRGQGTLFDGEIRQLDTDWQSYLKEIAPQTTPPLLISL